MDKTIHSEFKIILKLSLPIILSFVLMMCIDITDSIMASILGEKELASVATVGAFLLPITIFVIGIKMVLSPIISTKIGKKEVLELGSYLYHLCMLGLLLSIPVCIFFLKSSFFLNLMGIQPVLIEEAAYFLKFRVWGIPFLFLFAAYRYYFEGLGKPLPVLYGLLVGFGLNIILNACFMFGWGILPTLGVQGIGLSTAIVDGLMFLFLFMYEKKIELSVIPRVKFWYPLNIEHVKSILKLGVPSGCLRSIEVISFTVISLLLAKTTVEEVAAHQIALTISALTFMIPLGLSGAMASRIGRLHGEGDIQKLSDSMRVGIILTTVIMSVSAIILWVFRDPIAKFYHPSEHVLMKTHILFLIVAGYQVVDGLQIVFNGILSGLKDMVYPLITGFFSYWVFGFVPGYYLANSCGYGVIGYWLGLLSGLTCSSFLFGMRLWFKWKQVSKEVRMV